MGDRFSKKRAVLPILALAGFALIQAPGRSQDRPGQRGALPVPGRASSEIASLKNDARSHRLAERLRDLRAAGDLAGAARLFDRLFPPPAAGDPITALKTAAPAAELPPGNAGLAKAVAGGDGAYPVFVSPEREKNPSGDLAIEAGGTWSVFSAAEQWAGDAPSAIRIRKSADGGMIWSEAVVLGDGRASTRPSLRHIAEDAIGVAYEKEWAAGDGDIVFARLDGSLAARAESPVALSLADQTAPSLASDRESYAAPFLYVAYAEREGSAGTIEFRASRDLGATWSRAGTIASFPWPAGAAVDTALTYDPGADSLHVVFTRPQGRSTGVAVATSPDFGATWSRPVFLTPSDDRPDLGPRIAAWGERIAVVYEQRTGAAGGDVGLAYSLDAGRSWTTGARLAATTAAETRPDVRTSSAAGSPRFVASYIEDGHSVVVFRSEVSGPGSWTRAGVYPDGGGLALASAAVLPTPGPDGGESAGILWTDGSADDDIYFSPGAVTIALAELTVTPANRDVPSTKGTTSFSVVKTGEGTVNWTAAVIAGEEWLSIESGASGTNNGTIVAAFELNLVQESRVGSIRVTPDSADIPAITVTVTQGAAPVGTLVVTPEEGLASSGPQGGPFAPASLTYTLQNIGATVINWLAARTESWTTLSASWGTLNPGAARAFTVSINSNANSLAAGTYTDTVSFMNVTNGAGNTARPVDLTVTAAGGILAVTPATGLSSSGPVGGPFTPAGQAYTLQNTGGEAIDWTAAAGEAWVTVSPGAGILAAGATATVTVSIDAAGAELAAGTYTDTVAFNNTTNGAGNTTRAVSLTVNAAAGALAVTPGTGLASAGPVGGPFTPASQAYTLENTGGTAIDWTAAAGEAWVTVSPGAGTLAAGATATVTVSINGVADGFAAGTYTDTVAFTNATNGAGNTARPVDLTVNAAAGALAVTPATGLSSSGPVGGPFTPTSQAYTLENTGGTAIDWTAAAGEAWVTVSPGAGILAAGATATVTVSINGVADGFAAGTYTGAVAFTNTTNGAGNTARPVDLTVNAAAGALAVTPATGLSSSGPVGGPFTPTSQAYTLENTGGTAIDWTTAASQTWITVSPGAGTLAAGATATVTVSINIWANALGAGTYDGTASFTNQTNHAGDTARAVSLTVALGPALSVTPANRDVAFAAGATTFAVANTGGGTMSWTAAVLAGGDWLSITSGSSGTDEGTITASFTTNRNPSSRVGIIRVTAPGAAGSPRDVTVTQASGSISLTLTAERLVEKAWIIQREFGRVTVAVNNPAAVPVDRFVIQRRAGAGDYQALAQIAGSAVEGGTWVHDDAFLDPGVSYTYRVVAYDVLGSVIAGSGEVTI